jgi:flagellar protein FlgJ
MAETTGMAGVYTDFVGLAGLRAAARADQGGATERVARQFESLFVQMMLKSMRDATPDSGLFGSGMRMYEDLFDRQVSLELTAERGIGIADMLVRQLRGAADGVDGVDGVDGGLTQATRGAAPWPVPTAGLQPGPAAPRALPVSPVSALAPAGESVGEREPGASGPATRQSVFGSPEEFVRSLLPHAREAGSALGVDARVLLAQAALETGWGRFVMGDARGRSSHNFFGIKADQRWDGSSVRISTLESLGGVMGRVRADFRAYASPAEGFRDYVSFISDHDRYRSAVTAAPDPAGYLHGLQQAGYATDPRYAEKILDILGRSEFAAIVGRAQPAELIAEVF